MSPSFPQKYLDIPSFRNAARQDAAVQKCEVIFE
jgi:hypothetical protein